MTLAPRKGVTPLLRVCVAALSFILAAGAASGQSPSDPSSTTLAEEMRGVRLALERLVVLQETEEYHRRVDVLLKRIELSVARLEPLERMLQVAEGTVERLETSLRNLERMREQEEERLQLEIRDGVDDPHSETRRQLKSIERSEATQAERLEATRLKIQQLENDLMGDRRDIEILDEMLLELLEEGG